MQICHLTSSHPRYDIRIFRKECISLANAGFDVNLVVADGKGDEVSENVKIWDAGHFSSRKQQMLTAPKYVYHKALELNADVYHFHDPELIFIANKLRKKGKKVIFDAHEDHPRALQSRSWFPKPIMKFLAFFYELLENYVAKRLYAILTATPYITERFQKINKNTITINNYPLQSELLTAQSNVERKNEICYIGFISKVRGILQLLDALDKLDDVRLNLAGNFESPKLESEAKAHPAWQKVNYYGFVGRDKIQEILKKSKVGIMTLLSTPNHLHSQPIKLYEYMGAGIPVVASDFPYWKKIITENNVGLVVNPENSAEIAEKVLLLMAQTEKLYEYAQNGRKAVTEKYNWEQEERRLVQVYKAL